MNGPQISSLSGNRLHLHHGPIDLILWAEGADATRAYQQATTRFDGLLAELAAELPALRSPLPQPFSGPIAHEMARAVAPFRPLFITPMAAVAGAVADAVLAAMTKGTNLRRAYVNNGGDIAVYLTSGQSLTAAIASPKGAQDRVTLLDGSPARGIATSGWRGRSFSLGIADSVTVVARTAAMADAAATMIANAVDLPSHPRIIRHPAIDLQANSDLGDRLVTTDVGPLSAPEISTALVAGAEVANSFLKRGLIAGAALFLQSQTQALGTLSLEKEPSLA